MGNVRRTEAARVSHQARQQTLGCLRTDRPIQGLGKVVNYLGGAGGLDVYKRQVLDGD